MDFTNIIFRYLILALLVWSSVLGGSLWWNTQLEGERTIEMASTAATDNFNKDYAFRLWATSHQGVYVRPTEKTPPSPNADQLSPKSA